MTDPKAEKKVYPPLVPGPAKVVLVDSGLTGEDRFAIKVRVVKAEGACASNNGKHTMWSGRFVGEGTKYAMETLEGFGFDFTKQELKDFHPEKIHAGKEFDCEISNFKMPAKDGKPERTMDQIKYFRFDGKERGLESLKMSEAEATSASSALMDRIRAFKNGSTDGVPASGGAPNEFKAPPSDDLPF